MPTVINFSAAGARFKVDPAPSMTVTYDTTSSAVTSTDGGLDIDRVIASTQTVSSRATVATTENGAACPFAEAQDARFTIDRASGRVIPTIAASTDVFVSGPVVMQAPKAGRINVPVGVRAAMIETGRTYPVRAGTVAEHVEAAIAALVQGKTAGDATQALYSSNNYSTGSPAVTRNASLFCGALNWTGMSAISWDGDSLGSASASPAHLISPRHAITAFHYTQASTDTYVFVGADGTLHSRTKLAGRVQIGTSDVCLITLNADLPVTGAARVTPFLLLPQDFTAYLSPGYYRMAGGSRALNGGMLHALKRKRRPVVASYDTVGVSPLYLVDQTSLTWRATAQTAPSRATIYPTWDRSWISGDSGSGVFLPIRGELVLVTTGADASEQGPSPSKDVAGLRAAMEASVPGSTAQWPRIVDLSGFALL